MIVLKKKIFIKGKKNQQIILVEIEKFLKFYFTQGLPSPKEKNDIIVVSYIYCLHGTQSKEVLSFLKFVPNHLEEAA